MKIYLASRYSRRLEMCELKCRLESLGHTVTSRWLLGGHQWNGDAKETIDQYESGGMPVMAVRCAQDDINDIRAADTVIAFPDPPREPSTSRGGMHVELGFALGLGKRVIVCGIRQNFFHLLPEIQFFDSKSTLIEELGRLKSKTRCNHEQ